MRRNHLTVGHAFYTQQEDGFRASDWTRGPWSVTHQHGGPPAALMARAMERASQLEGARIARVTVEFSRPIPIATLETQVRVIRGGRSVERLEAEIWAEGRLCARANGVAIATAALELPATEPPSADPLPLPEASEPFEFPFFSEPVGYQTAMEVRLARGQFGAGKMAAWLRMKVPLIEGESPSPLQRVLVAADAGNGVSAALDPARYSFINADMTVHLSGYPGGEWIGLDGLTRLERDGLGLAQAELWDTGRVVGRSLQSLVVRER